MESYLFLLFFCIVENASVYAATSKENKIVRYGPLNILMEDLQGLNWGNDEALCLKQLLSIIQNVQNSTLWATWIWDSMQTPVGQLYGSRNNYGNYDECLEFPWKEVHPEMRTQYCLAYVHLADVDFKLDHVDYFGDVKKYIRGRTKRHLEFNTLKWGVCTPAICKPHSVSKFVGALFRLTHLGLAVDKPHISVSKCDIAGDTEVSRDFAYYLTWLIIVTSVSLTLLGTLYVNYKGLDEKSTGLMYAKAFYIPKNAEALIKVTDNDLRCLFGIRALTVVFVTFVHVWLLTKVLGISNAYRLDKDLEEIYLIAMLNFEIIVDTFTYMSGLLLIKSLLANGLKPFNPVKAIVKRYLRLILPILVVLLVSFKFVHIPNGPAKNEYFGKEMEACNKNWWAIPLMIHNYVNIEDMCYPVLWSVACDFHLAAIGTIGTWLFMKNRRLGLLIFLIGVAASIVVPATTAVFNPKLALVPGDFRSYNNYRKYLVGNLLYTPTHFRAGAYFVGMAAGYLITMYNPVTHRNVISKKTSIFSFGVFLIMFIGYFIICYFTQVLDMNIVFLTSYVSLKRIVWGMLLSAVIIICEYGTLPLVPGFLSWSAWVPFCRLSYGIYLVHIAILSFWKITTRSTSEYEFYNTVLITLGVSSASCIVSLILWTCFEEPMRIIVSLALRERKKTNDEEMKKK